MYHAKNENNHAIKILCELIIHSQNYLQRPRTTMKNLRKFKINSTDEIHHPRLISEHLPPAIRRPNGVATEPDNAKNRTTEPDNANTPPQNLITPTPHLRT
jgi:hypothetical protein